MSQPAIFDSHFIEIMENNEAGVVVASTICTSREIALTQAEKTNLGKAVHVAKTTDLTVYGDLVRIHGKIEAPGRKIKIVCRELQFHPPTLLGGISGIDVSGEKGKPGEPGWTVAAEAGNAGTELDRAGKTGKNGTNGGAGESNKEGGTIEIYCDLLRRLAPVVLLAKGGAGGDGAKGQAGGKGGNGYSNFEGNNEMVEKPGERDARRKLIKARGDYDRPTSNCYPEPGYTLQTCYFTAPSHGGEGGCGGGGGNGGAGGAGGTIKLQFRHLDDDPSGNFKIQLNVIGGNGGNGGSGGEGGRGGNGGSPKDHERHDGVRYLHSLDGADAGGGGIHGFPGYGGRAGSSGEIVLSKAGDYYARADVGKLPDPPPKAAILDKAAPDPVPDLPENLNPRELRARLERAKADFEQYIATLKAYKQATTNWRNECETLKQLNPYLPDMQTPGRDGDFPKDLDECAPAGMPGEGMKRYNPYGGELVERYA